MKKRFFGHLLGDGAAALVQAAGGQIVEGGPGDGDQIDAAVLGEAVVFHRNDGVEIQLGQAAQGGVAGLGPDGVHGVGQALLVQGAAVHLIAPEGQQPAQQQRRRQHQHHQPPAKGSNGSHSYLVSKIRLKGGGWGPALCIITHNGRFWLPQRDNFQTKSRGRGFDFPLRIRRDHRQGAAAMVQWGWR